jgi:hypothetical protein
MPDVARDLLSTAEVCRVLGITPREVHRLAAEGYLEIKHMDRYKHGNLAFFSERQVESVRCELPQILRRWEGKEGAE